MTYLETRRHELRKRRLQLVDGNLVANAQMVEAGATAITLLDRGVLKTLLPTLYGSRKTGLPHRPVSDGWEIAAGATPLTQLVGGVERGALVGPALSETMITGNVAQLLRDIVAVSSETLDGAGMRRPWLRVQGLHFS